MNLERFDAIVAAYGASPARWPEAERAEAMNFLHRSPEAAALVAREEALDAILSASAIVAPSVELQARVLATAAMTLRAPTPRGAGWGARASEWLASLGRDLDAVEWGFASWRQPLAALGCAATLGFALGIAAPAALDGTIGDEDDLLAFTFSAPLVEIDEAIVQGGEG